MVSDNIIYRVLFFVLVIITGIFTTITDLQHKKIRNNHLVIIAILAVALTIVKAFADKFSMLQMVSTGFAVIIALAFYKYDLWRGGDAKLFVLLSFLMPVTGYESKIFLPSIALFVNSFIIALIYLGLSLLKHFFADPKTVTDNVRKAVEEYKPSGAIAVTFFISWLTFPVFRMFGLYRYGVLSFVTIYVINLCLGKTIKTLIQNKAVAVTAFAIGFFLRYKFAPEFFLWNHLLIYAGIVVMYPLLALILSSGTKHIAKSDDRVPFSPFLFMGCLSSYTPFLWWLMSL